MCFHRSRIESAVNEVVHEETATPHQILALQNTNREVLAGVSRVVRAALALAATTDSAATRT
jgi:hypothetical protein